MSDEKRWSISQRRLVLFLMLMVVALSGICFYAIRGSQLQRTLKSAAPLVGTWKGDIDIPQRGFRILDLRSDGTARWRVSSGKTLGSAGKTIGYFEWTLDKSGEYVTYQFSSRRRALTAYALSPIFDLAPSSRGKVIEMSPTRFKLQVSYQDRKTGKTITRVTTYSRTQDEVLRSAR